MTTTSKEAARYVRASSLGSDTVHVARTRPGAMGTFAACNGRVMAFAVATTDEVTCKRCRRSDRPEIAAVVVDWTPEDEVRLDPGGRGPMTARKTAKRTPAPFARGQRVEVSEPGIRPWSGVVLSVKFSSTSGWWIDVDRDGGGCYVVSADVAR